MICNLGDPMSLCHPVQAFRAQSLVYAMNHFQVWHDPLACVTLLIHNSFANAYKSVACNDLCAPWLVHTWDMTRSYVCVDSLIRLTWMLCMCETSRSCVWHDSSICVTCLVHTRDMTAVYVWHVSFICVTWLIHTCDVSHSHAWHVSFICVTWLIYMRDVTRSMRDMIHACVWQRAAEEISLELWKALSNSCGLLVPPEGKS